MLQTLVPPTTSYAGSAFKPNGIYGVAPGVVNGQFAQALGRTVGAVLLEQGVATVIVGRDCRINGVELNAALQAGLRAAGVNVVDIGLTTTPEVYFAAHTLGTRAGISITGGHLPSAYNGFNIVLDDSELHGRALADIRDRLGAASRPAARPGTRSQTSIQSRYVEHILHDVRIKRPFKVAVDAGNGMAGALVPSLLRQLGCEVTELFCERDGDYPNHLPDPSDTRNLQDLIYCLRYSDCQIGLAFDGDGDRMVAVSKSGNIIGSDQLLILFGRDVLKHRPGARVIHDVQSSRHLPIAIRDAGGHATMWKTGRASIRKRMDEEGAVLGGDSNGHLIFKDRWYGFSDGVYTAVRLLELLSHSAEDATDVLDALPSSCTTPELRALTGAADPSRLIAALCNIGRFAGSDGAVETEGLRVEYADGFGLARASNSTSALVFRFEADSINALSRIQGEFRKQLRRVAPRLQLPF